MGKAAAINIFQNGGIPFIVGRDSGKLEKAKAEILAAAPERKGEVRTAALDCTDEKAVAAFFDGLEKGSVQHLVATLGPSAGASSILGASGFAKLKAQFDVKFFAQVCSTLFASKSPMSAPAAVIFHLLILSFFYSVCLHRLLLFPTVQRKLPTEARLFL
jgi:NAD(P)-dependent dehydrogenase (short-subunit alcohol dehydrogenase family)